MDAFQQYTKQNLKGRQESCKKCGKNI